jgi:hypothetical protein
MPSSASRLAKLSLSVLQTHTRCLRRLLTGHVNVSLSREMCPPPSDMSHSVPVTLARCPSQPEYPLQETPKPCMLGAICKCPRLTIRLLSLPLPLQLHLPPCTADWDACPVPVPRTLNQPPRAKFDTSLAYVFSAAAYCTCCRDMAAPNLGCVPTHDHVAQTSSLECPARPPLPMI